VLLDECHDTSNKCLQVDDDFGPFGAPSFKDNGMAHHVWLDWLCNCTTTSVVSLTLF
jgi:hypothetical protein